MMRVYRLLLLAGLAACGKPQPVTGPAPAETATQSRGSLQGAVTYRCESGARVFANYQTASTIQIRWNGRSYQLAATPAGSGARFSNGTLSWQTRGDRGSLEERGRIVASGCVPET